MVVTKIVAMYLPQFHKIKENDEWWGEGFTEWTNVKKGRPLFEGHLQPRVPYKYYDLSDPKELISQMKMAKEYGVDGFAFYHYWFGGKKLLEKPIECLWEYDETPVDYCLCWANESWNRRWNNEEKEILIKQDYGEKKEWEEHYHYLSAFFRKKNYIKKNNRPVIIIYNKRAIPCVKEMYECWRKLSKEDGFDGIHIVDVHRSKLLHEAPYYGDAVMRFEPFATIHEISYFKRKSLETQHIGFNNRAYRVIDYEAFCKIMIERSCFKDANQYLGFFAGWDNTPRVGENAGLLFDNNGPSIFEKYLGKQYEKSLDCNNDFLFINAWNEWGEGTFLEPDNTYGFGYLDAIKRIKKKHE